MSSMLSDRLRKAIRPAAKQLMRIAANVVLAYAWGGFWLFVAILIAERFDPDVTGVAGLVGSWQLTMFWLFVGAPLVLAALALIDLALYRVSDARLVGRMVSLLPGAAASALAFAGPTGLAVVAWLVATGLTFGHTMRLPPPAAK